MSARGRNFRCRCAQPIFFGNTRCLNCGAELGFVPAALALVPLRPAGNRRWVPDGQQSEFVRCANFATAALCNWLVPAGDGDAFCVACRLNRTIPDLSDAVNAAHWGALEAAKRRLVAQLLGLGLPVRSKASEDPERGLAFDFLRQVDDDEPVITGHADGVITINVDEADDAIREQNRLAMHEPYRTLLGHLRHEVGHYYWDRLILGSDRLAPYRALFGDERADYAAALRRHYENGAPPDWSERYISAYATSHPWEDWAETWAHYLHLCDGVATALDFGLDAATLETEAVPYTRADLHAPEHPHADEFLRLLNGWIELTTVLNELARSLGQPDFYPFVLSRAAVAKLHFVHLVVKGA